MSARRTKIARSAENEAALRDALSHAVELLCSAGVVPTRSVSPLTEPPHGLITECQQRARELGKAASEPIRILWHMPFSGASEIASVVSALPNAIVRSLDKPLTDGLGSPSESSSAMFRDINSDSAAIVSRAALEALHQHLAETGRRFVVSVHPGCSLETLSSQSTIAGAHPSPQQPGAPARSIVVVRHPLEAFVLRTACAPAAAGQDTSLDEFATWYTNCLQTLKSSVRVKFEDFAARPIDTLHYIASELALEVERESHNLKDAIEQCLPTAFRLDRVDIEPRILEQAAKSAALQQVLDELGYEFPKLSDPPAFPTDFSDMPDGVDVDSAVEEGLEAVLALDSGRGAAAIRVTLANASDMLDADRWLKLLPQLIAVGETATARMVTEHLRDGVFRCPSKRASHLEEVQWFEQSLVALEAARSSPTVVRGVIHFGVMRYRHPRRSATSGNLGDAVQTIASLGHMLRYEQVTLKGDPALVETLNSLQAGINAEFKRIGPKATVGLVPIDRDFSRANAVPDPTWLIANGWYMHEIHTGHFDFPFHRNVRPILISIHVADPDMLTQAVIEYLTTYGPVGCRDWYTTRLLKSRGVPAFFSGCLTTTIGMLYERCTATDGESLIVDAAGKQCGPRSERATHWIPGGLRDLPLADLLQRADERLRRYSRAKRIVTGRLHCYLPAQAIGVPVEFAPVSADDPRYGGLIGVNPESLYGIKSRLIEKLERVVPVILAGTPESTVYQIWREICARDVAKIEEALRSESAVCTAEPAQ